MSPNDNHLPASKLPSENDGRKDWPTASMRVSRTDLSLIDAAAYKLRVKRSQLMHDAVMERVRDVLNGDRAA